MAVMKRLIIVLLLVSMPLIIGLLFTYEIIKIDWISFHGNPTGKPAAARSAANASQVGTHSGDVAEPISWRAHQPISRPMKLQSRAVSTSITSPARRVTEHKARVTGRFLPFYAKSAPAILPRKIP
jgi:hypothetical protein